MPAPAQPVQIEEIIGRARQGMTRPFICQGENTDVYFVKGKGAGKRSLICEWLAGRLAQEMGLPIAPFTLVEVAPELLALGQRDDLSDLGAGLAFGSQKQPLVELYLSHLQQIDAQIQMDVLVFDWWVRNADRTLSDAGGNPNLFWNEASSALVVIDHNMAFDQDFSATDFAQSHAFRGQIDHLRGNRQLQQQYGQRMATAMQQWQAICDSVPETWWFVDDEQTRRLAFDCDQIKMQLMRYQDSEFWKMQ